MSGPSGALGIRPGAFDNLRSVKAARQTRPILPILALLMLRAIERGSAS